MGRGGEPAARGAAAGRAGDTAKHEQAGTTDDPAYEEACLVFYNREHVCRVPWSESVARSFAQMPNEVYMTMNGPSEFHCIGTLRTWDVTPRLGAITMPTLVISGRYDEATPRISQEVRTGHPRARSGCCSRRARTCPTRRSRSGSGRSSAAGWSGKSRR